MVQISALIAGILFLLASVVQAKEIALVIGIDEYTELPDLVKAREDAAGYRDLFSSRGFEVYYLENTSGVSIRLELAKFYDRIDPGDTVVFAYSGHGWSDGVQNYLVPADTPNIGSAMLAEALTIPLKNGFNGVLDQIARQGAELTVAIIDACRDNPFSQAETRSLGLIGGLAPMEAPSGTFIVYSAASGQTALDRLGQQDNFQYSVFTRFFIPNLRDSGDLVKAVRSTRNQVQQAAAIIGHQQRPAYYDELNGSSCIFGTCAPAAPPVPVTPQPQVGAGASQAAFTWSLIQETRDPQVLEAFVEKYEDTDPIFVTIARSKLLEFAIEGGLPVTLSTVGLPEPDRVEMVAGSTPPDTDSAPRALNSLPAARPKFAISFSLTQPQAAILQPFIQAQPRQGRTQIAMLSEMETAAETAESPTGFVSRIIDQNAVMPQVASYAVISNSVQKSFVPTGFGEAYEEALRRISTSPADAISLRLDIPGLSVIPAEISKMTHLKVLNLSGSNVYSLAPVATLATLESLDISGTNITNLDAIENFHNLQSLKLNDTRILSLAPLAALPTPQNGNPLRRLYASNTPVADISMLNRLVNMETLDLDGTQIEDVSALSALSSLKRLSLANTRVTDISMLRHLPELAEPNISGTPLESIRANAATDTRQGTFYHAMGNGDSEAIRYFRSAYEAYDWHALAAHQLGAIFYESRTVRHDFDKALVFFSEGSAVGRADSTYYLALMHERGEGTSVDANEAARLFMLSLEQGSDLLITRARSNRPAFTREVVERLQWALRSRNLYHGSIDGVIGGQSIRAFRSYCTC